VKRLHMVSFVLIIAICLSLSVLVGSPARAEEPTSWAGSCDVPGLTMAPVISKDKDNAGAPVKIRADGRGKYVPVVYIHGWTGSSVHNEDAKGCQWPVVSAHGRPLKVPAGGQ